MQNKVEYQPVYLTILELSLDDVKDCMKQRPEYKKTNKLGKVVMDIYI